MIQVYIVEDHMIVRQGLVALLEASSKMEVVGQTGHSLQALEEIPKLDPDVVVCDLGLPGIGGLELIQKLANDKTKFIVLSMYHDAVWIQRALDAGASGYVVKGSGVQDLVLAIEEVVSGKTFLSAESQSTLNRPQISPRETEILTFVAQGHTSKEIANLLSISVRTVEHHRAKLMDKIKIFDVAGLTRYAIRHGYVDLNLK